MSGPKSVRQPLRSSSIKNSSSKGKSPNKAVNATVSSVTPKKPSAKTSNMKSSRSWSTSKSASATESDKVRNSIERSRLAAGAKCSNGTLSNGEEFIQMPIIESQSLVTHSNVGAIVEKGSYSQDYKLKYGSTAVSPDKKVMSPPVEFSSSEREHQSDAMPTNRSTEPFEDQKIMILSDYQHLTIYSCNWEQSRRNCIPSPTRVRPEDDIAKSLSTTFTSLSRKSQVERGRELLRLIELGFDDFREFFNLQPMDEYSSYVLRLCQVELSHAQSQTMDDCLSRETQTEKSEAAPYSSWTQIPPAYEGSHSGHVRYASLISSIKSDHSSNPPTNTEQFSALTLNRLKMSLSTSLILLEEDCEEGSSLSDQVTHKPHNLVIPNQEQQTLGELECVQCEFLDHHLLTLHQLKSSQSTETQQEPLPGDIACVWKVDNHSGQGSLEHALKCPGILPMSGSELSDVCARREGIVCILSESSSKFNMVVGGLSDGSLAAWDLGSEVFFLHRQENISTQSSFLPRIFQYAKPPDYLAFSAFSENNKSSDFETTSSSPIISLKSLICKSTPSDNFQFCSLDSRGTVTIWMALRLQPRRSHGTIGSTTDFGLRPGGRARLIQLARFTYEAQSRRMCTVSGGMNISLSPFTTCLEACRTSDRFFIGSADGIIKQKCRVVSQRVYPEDFKLSFAVVAVTCIALHPFLPNVLIAGYSDGQLALFLTHYPNPIFKWLIKVQSDWPLIGVRKVVWSPHRPNVAFSLATDGDIIAWTLLDEGQAILKPRAQTLTIGTIREHKVVDFSVARGRSGCLAVCWQDGAEIHWLEENLVVRQEDELPALENALNELL